MLSIANYARQCRLDEFLDEAAAAAQAEVELSYDPDSVERRWLAYEEYVASSDAANALAERIPADQFAPQYFWRYADVPF